MEAVFETHSRMFILIFVVGFWKVQWKKLESSYILNSCSLTFLSFNFIFFYFCVYSYMIAFSFTNDYYSFLFLTQDFEKLLQLMQSHTFNSLISQNPPCSVDLARLTGFVLSYRWICCSCLWIYATKWLKTLQFWMDDQSFLIAV